ncbi:MAG: hypothetical protein Q9218_002770 [Villophora microphyllina]
MSATARAESSATTSGDFIVEFEPMTPNQKDLLVMLRLFPLAPFPFTWIGLYINQEFSTEYSDRQVFSQFKRLRRDFDTKSEDQTNPFRKYQLGMKDPRKKAEIQEAYEGHHNKLENLIQDWWSDEEDQNFDIDLEREEAKSDQSITEPPLWVEMHLERQGRKLLKKKGTAQQIQDKALGGLLLHQDYNKTSNELTKTYLAQMEERVKKKR